MARLRLELRRRPARATGEDRLAHLRGGRHVHGDPDGDRRQGRHRHPTETVTVAPHPEPAADGGVHDGDRRSRSDGRRHAPRATPTAASPPTPGTSATAATATGSTATHTYATAGTYTVTLDGDRRQGRHRHPHLHGDGHRASRGHGVRAGRLRPLGDERLGHRPTSVAPGRAPARPRSTRSSNGVGTQYLGAAGCEHLDGPDRCQLDRQRPARRSVSLDKAATGGGTYVYVTGRKVATNTEYRAALRYRSTARVVVALNAFKGSTSTAITLANETLVPGTVPPGRSSTCGSRSAARARRRSAPRSGPTAPTEPTAWTVSATDTFAGLQAPGWVGPRRLRLGQRHQRPADGLVRGPERLQAVTDAAPGHASRLVVQQSFPRPRPTTNPYLVMLRDAARRGARGRGAHLRLEGRPCSAATTSSTCTGPRSSSRGRARSRRSCVRR